MCSGKGERSKEKGERRKEEGKGKAERERRKGKGKKKGKGELPNFGEFLRVNCVIYSRLPTVNCALVQNVVKIRRKNTAIAIYQE